MGLLLFAPGYHDPASAPLSRLSAVAAGASLPHTVSPRLAGNFARSEFTCAARR